LTRVPSMVDILRHHSGSADNSGSSLRA
jgi:hypothetical protein